ncbi:hypothetical protein [Empedobacter tilapiae]|uniref:hypothetical protein n=1 Tax=Empedobacter tilapiae TaxID=2491114 RepID=UPI0028D38ADD|nr:hypothetical protein [Empedobacter tilapiae]
MFAEILILNKMHLLEVIGNRKIEINYDGVTVSLLIEKIIYSILVSGPYQNATNYFYIIHNSNDFYFNDLEDVNYELDELSLSKINAFLENFETGKYGIYKLSGNLDIIESVNNNVSHLYLSYENNRIIIQTNSTSNLNKDKVNIYKNKILSGKSPIIFIYSKPYYGAELEHIFFIIHGNEILKAYRDLNLEPKFIAIVNYTEFDYDKPNQSVVKIISSYKEIRETSYKYFY